MLGSRLVPMVLIGLCLLFSVWAVSPAHAQTSLVCERALAAAEDQYLDAAYDEALRLVTACLNQDAIPDDQAVAAYRMLALIHLKQDELDSARAAIVNLLGVDPTYTADPIDSPPAYVSLVSIVKRDLQRAGEGVAGADTSAVPTRPPFFRRSSTWITMTGILVGSGVATFFAINGGSGGPGGGDGPPTGPDPLPIPPGTPPGSP